MAGLKKAWILGYCDTLPQIMKHLLKFAQINSFGFIILRYLQVVSFRHYTKSMQSQSPTNNHNKYGLCDGSYHRPRLLPYAISLPPNSERDIIISFKSQINVEKMRCRLKFEPAPFCTLQSNALPLALLTRSTLFRENEILHSVERSLCEYNTC